MNRKLLFLILSITATAQPIEGFNPSDLLYITTIVNTDFKQGFLSTLGSCTAIGLSLFIHNKLTATEVAKPLKSSPAEGNIKWVGALPPEIENAITLTQNTKNMESFKLTIPKGFLLSGPPGNGKTLLAKHIAKTLSASFIQENSAALLDKYYGVTASKLRNLLASAKSLMAEEKTKMCIVFLDEIDAIAIKRSSIVSNALFENSIINQLLTLISEDENNNIMFIGATNNLQAIDPALIRSGRLKPIIITNPDKQNIAELFKHYISFHNPQGALTPKDNEALTLWASTLEGYVSRADIQHIVINAATNAALTNEENISLELLQNSVRDSFTRK